MRCSVSAVAVVYKAAVAQGYILIYVRNAGPAKVYKAAYFAVGYEHIRQAKIAVRKYALLGRLVCYEPVIKLRTAKDIQEFYLSELERVSPSSVIHYHANIHKALKYAVKIDLIDVNPADKVERPKKDRYVGSFYDADEVNDLFEAAKGSKLELPILFGAFYGLRRS